VPHLNEVRRTHGVLWVLHVFNAVKNGSGHFYNFSSNTMAFMNVRINNSKTNFLTG
jgi:hypothetical protein